MPLGESFPPWPPPPLEMASPRDGPPRGPINSGGREGSRTTAPGASLSLPLALGEALPGSPLLPPPRRRAAGSPSTSPFPLAGSRRRRHRCSVRVLNAEVSSVRRSVIGDLDHDEYDSINPILLNASARDLQGYVDALPFPWLLDNSID